MKTIISLLIISLFTTGAYAQVPCSKGEHVPSYALQFSTDLQNNTLKIYTLGGLKPSDRKADAAFQKEYKVTYHDFGCLAPGNMEFFNAYNRLVFGYLSKERGNKWRKSIKDNAMGLYNWNVVK